VDIKIKPKSNSIHVNIKLNASKSESNRVLVLNALSGNHSTISNLANARDTVTMQRLLGDEKSKVWDVLDAGTTMRFLTAYTAVSGNSHLLTGTERMQNRPIKVLGDALANLGAGIQYENKPGYPPLVVSPLEKQLVNEIDVPGNISSQYISALLMIAPKLEKGLKISIDGTIFSRPYIEMTLSLMKEFGISHQWNRQQIIIAPQNYQATSYTVESDWSGASYWYSMAALSDDCEIFLGGLRKNSNQGDQAIASIMEKFGIITNYEDDGVRLSKDLSKCEKNIFIDFKSCPDLAQTVIACAAEVESAKLGGTLIEENSGWYFTSQPIDQGGIIEIDTYEDHRMAMAFAPLSLQYELVIKDREVVNKSYPDFWTDLAKAGLAE